jgi:hypothetical protein
MIPYNPEKKDVRLNLADVPSAWKGIETIIPSIMKDFNIQGNKALEFGVDYGYSTSVLANYFTAVTGVDVFTSGQHGHRGDGFFDWVSNTLKPYPNITLIKQDYKDYIKHDIDRYDMIHIDIIHEFTPTYECAEWSLEHSNVVILHDTESYTEVRDACKKLEEESKCIFHNVSEFHGVGVLIKK